MPDSPKRRPLAVKNQSSPQKIPKFSNTTELEPNSKKLAKCYKKIEEFVQTGSNSYDDIYDRLEQCLSYVQKQAVSDKILWNNKDYNIIFQIMTMVAYGQCLQKYLDSILDLIEEIKNFDENTICEYEQVFDRIAVKVYDPVSIFFASIRIVKQILKDRVKLALDKSIDYSEMLSNYTKTMTVCIVQAYLDVDKRTLAQEYLTKKAIKKASTRSIASQCLIETHDKSIKILADTPYLVAIIHSRYKKFIFKAKLNVQNTLKEKRVEQLSIEQHKKSKQEKTNNIENNPDSFFKVNNKIYLKLKLLGKGGFAKVYKVFDREGGNEYALKVIDCESADPAILKSFETEIESLKSLAKYNNIINLIDYEILDIKRFLVLECGETDLLNFIKERIKNERRVLSKTELLEKTLTETLIPVYELRTYFRHMILAVDSLHKSSIIHLDLKPANFILVKGIVKLIDFGISNKLPKPESTSFNMSTSAGTPNYMAPEQFLRQRRHGEKVYRVGRKADVWALGCILHYMAFSETPYQSIQQQHDKIMNICDYKKVVPIRNSKYENLNGILRDKLLVKKVDKRSGIGDLLVDDFFNGNVDTQMSFSNMSSVPKNQDTDPSKSLSLNIGGPNVQDIMSFATPGTKKKLKSILDKMQK